MKYITEISILINYSNFTQKKGTIEKIIEHYLLRFGSKNEQLFPDFPIFPGRPFPAGNFPVQDFPFPGFPSGNVHL